MSKRILFATVLAVASIGVGGVAIAAPSAAGHGTPVYRTAPTAPPSSSYTDGECTVHGYNPDATSGDNSAKTTAWIRKDPVGVTGEWLPGTSDKQCRTELTVSQQKIARRLAKEIETATPVKPGAYSCPLDDGVALRLYFSYSGGKQEYINVSLSGCRWLGAPGRGVRQESQELTKTLKQIAPGDWRSDLS